MVQPPNAAIPKHRNAVDPQPQPTQNPLQSRPLHMSEPRSRNWLKISCIGCVGLPCVGLMLTFGFIKCQVSKEGDNLPAELAKLKKLGVPTEPQDLSIVPPVPDSDNAASLYKQIEEEMKKVQKGLVNRHTQVISAYSGFPGDKVNYEVALAQHQSVFSLIDQLPTRSRLDYKRDYTQGFNLLFPEFAETKSVAKLLASRTQYWIERKDYDRALKDIETQYVIANHLSQEVTIIGALVCIAINAIAHNSLDRFLYAVQDNQPMLAKTEAMLVRRQRVPSIRKSLSGEVVMGRIGIQSLKSWAEFDYSGHGTGEPDGLQKGLDRLTVQDPAFRRMFEARAMAMWREIFEKAPKDEQDWVGFSKAFREVDAKIQADNSVQNKLNQILFPVFDQASQAFAKADANHRVALLAVKLLRMPPTQRPANLSSFGKLAIDPMDGKPMRYLRKGNGFKVWSIGQDLKDNGGVKAGIGIAYNMTDLVLGYKIGFPPPTSKAVMTSMLSSPPGGPATPTAPGSPPPPAKLQ